MTRSNGQMPKPGKFKDTRVTASKKGKQAISCYTRTSGHGDFSTSWRHWNRAERLPKKAEMPYTLQAAGLLQESLLILHSLWSYSMSNSSGFNCVKSKVLISSNLGSQLLHLRDRITTEKTPEARWQKGAINSHRCETTVWKRKQEAGKSAGVYLWKTLG